MPATMRILGWKAQGLRCPDHEIDCCHEQGVPAQVTLIQMPNGTGKTTTLTLLRAALSGLAEKWNPVEVRSMRKKGEGNPDGIFELRFALNGKRITISMEFDFQFFSVRYKTTRSESGGREDGFDPPFELQHFMDEKFVNFYVFDGELADHLLSKKHTHAERAVEYLFQTDMLKDMLDKVSKYWDEEAQKHTAKSEKGLSQRKNQLQDWRQRKVVLCTEKKKCTQQCEELNQQLKIQKKKYSQAISREKDREEKIKAAKEVAQRLEHQVKEKAHKLLDNMRNPNALSSTFSNDLYSLKSGLDRVKLPETTAREFFQELAEEKECVCGRVIDDTIRTVIRERAQSYLGSDDITLLNSVKTAISDVVAKSRDAAATELSREIDTLSRLTKESQQAKNDLDNRKRDAEQSNPDAKSANEKIEELKLNQEGLRRKLHRFEDTDGRTQLKNIGSVDPSRIESIVIVEEGIRILEERVQDTNVILRKKKKRDILMKILESAHSKSKMEITSDIRDQSNNRIETLMPYNNIRIDRIEGCLVLKGQSGGSVGETLAVGYAFLSTLFDRADQHRLPFIVDSPANPIDLDVRPKIGNLVPKLTGQFIAFVISSEREKFLPNLKKASEGNVQFITLFRKGISHHEAKAQASPACVTTTDGMQVMDEQFFNEFQLDEETD